MKKSEYVVAAIGMLLIGARLASLHGRTWEFGPNLLPVAILSPDGSTYRDGSEIDWGSRAIIDSGMYEAWWAGCLAGIAGCALVIARSHRIRQAKQASVLGLAKRNGTIHVEPPSKSAER